VRGHRFKALAVLAGTVVLGVGGLGSSASARDAPKDCGKLTTGGFGGPLPKGIPSGSVPQLHAFRVSGSLSCKTVHSVMQKFENNAKSTLTINKPPAPGWKCKFNKKARGYVCKMGKDVIEDQTVYKLNGKTVGPAPRTP
jgi:hypothetical protein